MKDDAHKWKWSIWDIVMDNQEEGGGVEGDEKNDERMNKKFKKINIDMNGEDKMYANNEVWNTAKKKLKKLI